MKIRSAAVTDIGRVRSQNEDRFMCNDQAHFYAVADGLGGLPGGELAAQKAVDLLGRVAESVPLNADLDLPSLFEKINQAVHVLGLNEGFSVGLGTTLTFLSMAANRARIAHVGDSACFQCRA